MGFFNELKSDLSQAVNTILPTEDEEAAADPLLAAAVLPRTLLPYPRSLPECNHLLRECYGKGFQHT